MAGIFKAMSNWKGFRFVEENLISGARIELFIGGGMLEMQSNWVGWKGLGFALTVSLAQLRRTKEILSKFQLP